MNTIYIAGKERAVTVQRKRNKNMYLRVREDGSLFVTVPYRTSERDLLHFLEKNENWIRKADQRGENRLEFFRMGPEGRSVLWLGKRMPVHVVPSFSNTMFIEEDHIEMRLNNDSEEQIRNIFYNTGNQQLLAFIGERRKDWDHLICDAHHKQRPLITIRYMTSRWGSCTPKTSRIRISSRLIHYPLECLDYVLLHEYVHLLVPNHSKQFYDTVERYMPDYRRGMNMLK